MNTLNKNWQPSFGTMYYWLAVDMNGKIARMMNNNWGNIPQVLLSQNNIENILDSISEYIWEESKEFQPISEYKNGNTILDLYSKYPIVEDREDKELFIAEMNRNSFLSDENLPSKKGIFIYQAIESFNDSDGHLVEYNKRTIIGDYYRYLLPTIYASIYDFPRELWKGIAVSNSLDFTKDRLIANKDIDNYFTDVVN